MKDIKNKKLSHQIFSIETFCFSLDAREYSYTNWENQYKYPNFLLGYLICCGGFSSPHAPSTAVYLSRSAKLTLMKNSRNEKHVPVLQNIKDLSLQFY